MEKQALYFKIQIGMAPLYRQQHYHPYHIGGYTINVVQYHNCYANDGFRVQYEHAAKNRKREKERKKLYIISLLISFPVLFLNPFNMLLLS